MECTQPERYVLRRLPDGPFLAIAAKDGALVEVSQPELAYLFHTHEAALRAAAELNRLGKGVVDVMKLELDVP